MENLFNLGNTGDKNEAKKLINILHSLPVGICVLKGKSDGSARIVNYNPAFLSMVGLDEESVKENYEFDSYTRTHPDDAEALKNILRSSISEQKNRYGRISLTTCRWNLSLVFC